MNIINEEKFLIDHYESARYALEMASNEVAYAAAKKRAAEKSFEDVRQALVDYMQGNGLVKTDRLNIAVSTSKSVEVTDIDSVPEEYLRITKEVNKAAIKALNLPENNWLKYKTTEKITLTVSN